VRKRGFANGKLLESELRAYHNELANVWGAPKIGRLHAAKLLGAAAGDFSGLTVQGRPVLVEAKEVTSKARFELDMVKPHQLRGLREAATKGGIGVLVVRVQGVTWALSSAVLDAAIIQHEAGGPASLSPADLDRVGARLEGVRWWGVEVPGRSERQRGLFGGQNG